jgi:hyperosmotically inducible protein
MKRTLQRCFILLASVLVLGAVSCKKKLKDTDIQASIEAVLSADADMKSTMVTVKDGVATISGECKDEACKARCEDAVKKVEGVKSVVNNCTVAPPPAVVPPVSDALSQAIADAVKDYPGVKTELSDGVLTLTGEIERANLQKLMMALNSLKSMGIKKIESAGLVKK